MAISRYQLVSTSALASLLVAGDIAHAQEPQELPPIEVTASRPIVRRPAAPRTPSAPPAPAAAETPAPGTLPIVTDQFATVTVVPNEELRRLGGGTLGDVLFAKPGITGSSAAPGAASRPIVRGLDMHRVRVQENGLGSSGASDLGEDHGVPLDPLATGQVEVMRGPATLRWGSQAIGGVVNATNNRIPDALPYRPTVRSTTFPAKAPGMIDSSGCMNVETRGAVTSVDDGLEGAVLLDAGKGNVALHADAYGRRTDDYRVPRYPYLFPPDSAPAFNGRQPNSSARSNGQAIGGSYLFDGGFAGISIARFDSLYRVPGIEATATNARIDMNQTKIASKGEYRPPGSAIEAIRYWAGATDYKHNELANEGGFDGIQQTFTNKEQEGRLEIQLAPFDLRFARLTTALGVQGMHQRLTAPGAEPGPQSGLFDPNSTNSVAGFLFNELKLSDTLRMQVSGRIESNNVKGSLADLAVDPDTPIVRNRTFTPKSAAIGFLHDLPWNMVASLTAQHVERAPRAPELLSRGVHEATGTFDIGNPNLRTELANSVEIGLRRAKGPLRFEATLYHTRFNGFIYRALTGETCDEDFSSCTPGGGGGDLRQAFYSQRDATFRGGEFQLQWEVAPLRGGVWGIDGQYDFVRATFTDGTNVPRIPPQRFGGGLFWRDQSWLAKVFLLHALPQNDIAVVGETPTAGYNLLRAEVSYTKELARNDLGIRELRVGLVGDNLLNEDIRNHVSFKKDEVLMPGIGVRAFANVKF